MRTLCLGCLLLAALPPGACRARADFARYSYHWAVSPGPVLVGTNPNNGPGGGFSTGSLLVDLAADGAATIVLGGPATAIRAAAITAGSTASAQSPDSFAAPFELRLRLTDTASGEAGELTFGGTVRGTLTAASSTLVAELGGALERQVTLGGLVYSVGFDASQTAVPAPDGGAPALLEARVRVGPGSDPTPPVSQAPEPSSWVLAAAAVPLAALARRRRADAGGKAP